ncbi:MAG: 6-aminohexanoate hydrolase, partial [Betaproteobacteria bacterium]|nr:6-aminohexanoate hydrolase [Betaproteobacteria bacterium]
MHDAQSSDPVSLGWMQGHPPAEDRRIRAGDAGAYRFPQIRWSFSH